MADSYRILPLTRGQVALLDPEDYDRAAKHKWCALYLNKNWYAQRQVCPGQHEYLHRFVMGVTDPKVLVDHRNRIPLDCRRENLRLATLAKNNMNRRCNRAKVHGAGLKGVSLIASSGKWRARIRERVIGTFPTAEDAAMAYDQEAMKEFGEFACLNFPEVECPLSDLNGRRTAYEAAALTD